MTPFHEYLLQRLAATGFSTEDTIAAFIPLAREVLEAHTSGNVAPLCGVASLREDGGKIYFEESERRPMRRAESQVEAVAQRSAGALDIVGEFRRTTEIGSGGEELKDLSIGQRGAEIVKPVYLPGFVAWEHELEHHDPVTDVYSLGMILASMACALDLGDPESLARFVAARDNLFTLNHALHPVVARAIVRMTELDPRRRAQDLPSLVASLENYRDQEIDFNFDLARLGDYPQRNRHDKQQVVLERLRERLFEISRRNRLLHFRATLHTVNLTQASVPLSFDIKQIRHDQILVWNEQFQQKLLTGRPVSLNKHLNFAEALYLPGLLDQIGADVRRDMAEFGFAQLRLVACFLHWANLKERPFEQFSSPLVLVPVALTKKKGIRDTWWIELQAEEAEINPVVRHLFKQLYGIDLPETIDLTTVNLTQFHAHLAELIQASDPSVELRLIDRPRIELVYEKARRKLDQYQRRAQVSGRGVRNFMDLDYSYDPANYHPLGIKLFSARIRPPSSHLRELVERRPRPRSYAAPEPAATEAHKERSVYHFQDGAGDNPYTWTLDLCSVTLANFKYRKMSLVRDYESLLDEGPQNPAFDAAFSLAPREVAHASLDSLALDQRFDVVPCDPTQAASIGRAREGESYIIQGPPGTGKSQTITNLIADYVARGKRVLFVCEKRAAIDVVYARLRQCGLGDLCCLIHDSQADKKSFVMNLKHSYETFLPDGKTAAAPESRRDRTAVLRLLQNDLEALDRFAGRMTAIHPASAVPVRQLLNRCVELRDHRPELDPIAKERLPDYQAWCDHREDLERFDEALRATLPSGVLAEHPLRSLAAAVASAERPLETLTTALAGAGEALDLVDQQSREWNDSSAALITEFEACLDHAICLAPFAGQPRRQLLDDQSSESQHLEAARNELVVLGQSVTDARAGTESWRRKLPADELTEALELAERLERTSLPWLRWSWWRLRSILNRCYDFSAHVFKPSWTKILKALELEYQAEQQREQRRQALGKHYGVEGDIDGLIACLDEMKSLVPDLPPVVAEFHTAFRDATDPPAWLDQRRRLDAPLQSLNAALHHTLDGYRDHSPAELRQELERINEHLDQLHEFLYALQMLAPVDPEFTSGLRRHACTVTELEAAIADKSLDAVYHSDPLLDRFTSVTRADHASNLEERYAEWLAANAAHVRETVRGRFVDRVSLADRPANQLTADEKTFKKRYSRGRRELEHEFGKSMRYKSIRDLVAGDSGEVLKDLKPVWLMSPLSVSDTLPLDTQHVDVVIFDEASQITLEEAIPSLFRATQTIVVGDEMQLPPTDFFSAKRTEEEELMVDDDGELVVYDLDSNSLLNHASRNLSATLLGWHYRSRSESLISFSNWAFYEGRLLTVPEERLSQPGQTELLATSAENAADHAAEVLIRPISFHFLEQGVYEQRRNRGEADYIAHLVRSLMATRPDQATLGIVAFSEAQQDEIDSALGRLAQADREFGRALEAEREREEDGQFLGLLVKNLENIQGDERDIIILSICYGPDPNGKMLMNFGPINKSGGEKRLNVAFSRAKHHMVVISSIRDSAITNDYNEGARCLKNYLRYAEAASTGDAAATSAALGQLARGREPIHESADGSEPVLIELEAAMRHRGYLAERHIGQSHFRCDLAVRREGDTEYRLGILLDSSHYYAHGDILERDVMRPKLLRAFGWNLAFVLAKDWYANRDAVLDRLEKLMDHGTWAER